MINHSLGTSIVVGIILCGILVGVLQPLSYTQAGVIDSLVDTAEQASADFIICYATIRASDYLRRILSSITDFIRNLLSSGAIGGTVGRIGAQIFGGKVPVTDDAQRRQTAISEAQQNKELVLDPVVRCLSQRLLDRVIGGVHTVIRQGGRDGAESYVKNWRNFQLNGQYRGEVIFQAILANTPVCDYLRSNIDRVFRTSSRYKLPLSGINLRIGNFDPFTLRARCTLPAGFDIAKYRQDFVGNGGWAAFERLLEPQNNALGLALLAQDERAAQQKIEEEAELNDALAGDGYLSITGRDRADSCSLRAPTGICIKWKDIKTPASYLGGAAIAALGAEFERINSSDEYRELLVERLVSRLVYRLMDLGAQEATPGYNYEENASQGNIPPPVPLPTEEPDPSLEPVPTVPPVPGPSNQPPQSGPSAFGNQVRSAIDQYIAQNPSIFVTSSSPEQVIAGQENTYILGVVAILSQQGFRARQAPEAGDVIEVKQSNAFSEEYDILTSNNLVRRPPGAFRGSTSPAVF